ncbi:MAG: DUF234 domain-containing protein, partial [Spirochaetaceae bacterium]|nr:DUF234 domain-containing protein [Spirochaetaceae bacterium]
MLAKPSGRRVKYRITDNFLNFWFRFIYKYRSAVELRNFDWLKTLVRRDYNTYSGAILERYFTQKLSAEGNFSVIGSYWERANQNEIDIVALNEGEGTAVIAEVKRQPENIHLCALREKASNLAAQLEGYAIEYRGLSLAD